MKKAILIVSFGTTYPDTRQKNIAAITRQVRALYPDAVVEEAVSSTIVRNAMKKREHIEAKSPTEALESMKKQGVTHVAVFPTHVIDGIENHRLKEAAKKYAGAFEQIAVADALLAKPQDYEDVAKALWESLKEEVGELTGVVPDFHVIIQWEAVGKLVDAIDGVWFDVPRRMYYNDLSQDFKIDLKEGYQLLDGSDAMGLLRWRHNSDDSGHILNSGYATGDLGRIETQQSFMKAVVAKCLQPDVLLPNLMEYISIFQENVVTNLNVSNMAYFGKSAIGGLDMDNVEFLTMPNKSAGDGAHLLPIASEILEVVNERFNPYLEDLRLNELDVVSSISSGSSGGKGGQTAATPTPARPVEETPDVGTEPSPSPAPGGESTPPAAAETPAPSGSAAPIQTPVQSAAPAATPSPVQTAQPTPPPAETPVTTPDGASGPGMEPIE